MTDKPNEEKYMVTADARLYWIRDKFFYATATGEYTEDASIGEVVGHIVGKALRAGVLDDPDFKITVTFQQRT